jgi:hypothetical protein
MICLEITVNGQRYCLAGIGEEGSLSAFVTWVKFGPEGEPNLPVPPGSTLLSVSGFTKDRQAVHWGDAIRHLSVGDEVKIRVVETATPDGFTLTPTLAEDKGDRGNTVT